MISGVLQHNVRHKNTLVTSCISPQQLLALLTITHAHAHTHTHTHTHSYLQHKEENAWGGIIKTNHFQ